MLPQVTISPNSPPYITQVPSSAVSNITLHFQPPLAVSSHSLAFHPLLSPKVSSTCFVVSVPHLQVLVSVSVIHKPSQLFFILLIYSFSQFQGSDIWAGFIDVVFLLHGALSVVIHMSASQLGWKLWEGSSLCKVPYRILYRLLSQHYGLRVVGLKLVNFPIKLPYVFKVNWHKPRLPHSIDKRKSWNQHRFKKGEIGSTFRWQWAHTFRDGRN